MSDATSRCPCPMWRGFRGHARRSPAGLPEPRGRIRGASNATRAHRHAPFVAEDDEFLAEQLYFLRKIAKLIRRADRLPIAAQQFAHRAPRLDACQLIIRAAVSGVRMLISSLPPIFVTAGVWALWLPKKGTPVSASLTSPPKTARKIPALSRRTSVQCSKAHWHSRCGVKLG